MLPARLNLNRAFFSRHRFHSSQHVFLVCILAFADAAEWSQQCALPSRRGPRARQRCGVIGCRGRERVLYRVKDQATSDLCMATSKVRCWFYWAQKSRPGEASRWRRVTRNVHTDDFAQWIRNDHEADHNIYRLRTSTVHVPLVSLQKE